MKKLSRNQNWNLGLWKKNQTNRCVLVFLVSENHTGDFDVEFDLFFRTNRWTFMLCFCFDSSEGIWGKIPKQENENSSRYGDCGTSRGAENGNAQTKNSLIDFYVSFFFFCSNISLILSNVWRRRMKIFKPWYATKHDIKTT